MSSYLITGAARGIGYELIRQYSRDPKNTVIGLVRNKAVTDKKISEDAELKSRSNLHIIEADITNYNALQSAAAETTKITGGSLDYIIGNAGLVSKFDAFDGFRELSSKPEGIAETMRELNEINVIGNIHLFNTFVPLLLKGKAKKAIVITSGLADIDLTNNFEVAIGPLYSASKAAVNMVVAKYNAEYKKDGLLFLALSPGMVDVGHYEEVTEEQQKKLGGLLEKFLRYAPHFKGPITPEQSVTAMRSVIENVSIEKGNGGDFLSHLGTKQWL